MSKKVTNDDYVRIGHARSSLDCWVRERMVVLVCELGSYTAVSYSSYSYMPYHTGDKIAPYHAGDSVAPYHVGDKITPPYHAGGKIIPYHTGDKIHHPLSLVW